MMIALAVLCLLVSAAAAGCLAHDWFADKWADYSAGSPELSAPEALRGIPEPSWPSERRRSLAASSLPIQPSAYERAVEVWRANGSPAPWSDIAPPPADDSWLESLLAEDPLQVPSQRKPGSAS